MLTSFSETLFMTISNGPSSVWHFKADKISWHVFSLPIYISCFLCKFASEDAEQLHSKSYNAKLKVSNFLVFYCICLPLTMKRNLLIDSDLSAVDGEYELLKALGLIVVRRI